MKASQRRPFIGRFMTSLRLTTVLTSVLSVSTTDVLASTVTVEARGGHLHGQIHHRPLSDGQRDALSHQGGKSLFAGRDFVIARLQGHNFIAANLVRLQRTDRVGGNVPDLHIHSGHHAARGIRHLTGDAGRTG